jgi:sigma-B regulation protein RsbU (phosphoserine phosphatase)
MTRESQKIAREIQTRLLANFIGLVRSSTKQGMLQATLQNTVDLTAEISGAEKGSLFLLDAAGVVTDCIIMRESASHQERLQLIGRILNQGLAGWVVKHRTVGLVQDTRTDNRWLELPDQPYKARSAVVTPILKGGQLFGLLSLVHARPKRFDLHTVELLQATADHIAIVLENAKLYQELNQAYRSLETAKEQIEAYSNALDAELQKGRRMQRNFLPRVLPEIPGWKINACFHPAKQVSGDFYDVFPLPAKHLGLLIGDVCDKGVSAALFMGIFRSLLHAYLEGGFGKTRSLEAAAFQSADHRRLAAMMVGAIDFVNRYIDKHHGREGIFATLFFGILDTDQGRLAYINAGHEPLVLIRSDRSITELTPTGPSVGMMAEAQFSCLAIQLDFGETLIGFTDGVIDACPREGKAFGREGVMASLTQQGLAPDRWIDTLARDVFAHLAGAELTDDISMLAVHRKRAQP